MEHRMINAEPISQARVRDQSPQVKATSSCAECRRRRIKCDGATVPCRQCSYYQVAHLCHYPRRKPRTNVSWRMHTELSDAYEKARQVVKTLFPSSTLDELSCMSRDQLMNRLHISQWQETSNMASEGEEQTLQMLESSPERDYTWDEVSDSDSQGSRTADNMNGLEFWSESVKESYLGLPSIPVILRVISHLAPRVRELAPSSPETEESLAGLEFDSPENTLDLDEASLIDAYFYHVHPITPMIDETAFRRCYSQNSLIDYPTSSWLALLNMVLALGCLASDKVHFREHNIFYKRATKYLGISSFGSGHLYTVQALGIYGGYLLHYLHKPNMASAVLGAAIRMAVAMGMHRVRLQHDGPESLQQAGNLSVTARIRTWWSLFCLDTWAATTLGRPGLGYWNPMTVVVTPTSSLTFTDYSNISLAASEDFCKIATRIQDRLVQSSLMTAGEIKLFDEDLLRWRNSLHTVLDNRNNCPPRLQVARGLLWSRFMTTRLTLYRPCLLKAALRQSLRAEDTGYDESLLCECLKVARDTIDTLTLDWFPNQLVSWNSAWHLFQAVLVLILALALDKAWAKGQHCDEYVTKALELFARVEHASPGGTHSREVIRLLHQTIGESESSDCGCIDTPPALTLDSLDVNFGGDDSAWLDYLWVDT